MRVVEAIGKFAALSEAERALLMKTAGAAMAVSLVGRMMPPSTAVQVLGTRRPRRRRSTRHSRVDRDTVVRLVDAVLSRLRGPWKATCVTRAIIIHRLLREQGIDSRVHFGTQRNGEAFEGHVWVEADGVPVGEWPDVRKRHISIHSVSEC